MFLYHGTEDAKLPLKGSAASYDYLRNKVYKGSDHLEFVVEEDLGSDISEEEWVQMGKFIHKLTKETQVVDPKELDDTKKMEPAIEDAVSKIQTHIDKIKMRKQGMAPQVLEKGAFIQRAALHHQKHHLHHHNN